jgi:hypothetical protein
MEDPENGKELPHSAHANGMNERTDSLNFKLIPVCTLEKSRRASFILIFLLRTLQSLCTDNDTNSQEQQKVKELLPKTDFSISR